MDAPPEARAPLPAAEGVPVRAAALRGVRRPPRPARFALRVLGVEPVVRLVGWAARTALAELAGRLGDRFGGAERRAERTRRAAERLAELLGELKGAFAKAGQFASLRVDVLPPDLRGAFAALRDRVPPLPAEQIAAVIEDELGAPLGALFAEFDPVPLGAASVAQVHRARLPDGEWVAVKVQFPWLERSVRADVALVGALVRLLVGRRARGVVDPAGLAAEFAASWSEELDFEREADAAEAIAANLAGERQVVVPAVHRALSTRRVLTTAYVPAIPIADRAALERRSLRAADVLEVIARAYAKQVFVDGLFHADPHPGNLFVVDEPEAAGRPRVLFVDFGLSKRLPPALRREMRLGLGALLRQDAEAFVDGMERMRMMAPGARDAVRRSVEAMFARLRGEGSPLALRGGQVLALKDEAKALLAETPGVQLPSELLHWAKTLSYLFALGQEIAPEVDLVRVCLPYLLRYLAEPDPADSVSR